MYIRLYSSNYDRVSINLFGSGRKYKGHSLLLNSREKHFSIPSPHGQLWSFSTPMLHRVPAILFLPSCFLHKVIPQKTATGKDFTIFVQN